MADELRSERRGQVAWLTIDREARRNALGPETIAALRAGLDAAEADPAVRAVCITGAGDRAFCAGADLRGGLQGAPGDAGADAEQGPGRYAALLRRLRTFGKPLVARVNGDCLAGGVGLVLSCDVVIAREGARFGLPEVTVGLFPMMVAALLVRDGLRKKVLELAYTGARIGAREAEAMGLVTRAVPDDALDAEVGRVLEALAAAAPRAVQLGRRALAEVEGLPFDEAVERLCARLGEVLATEDALEGLSAFVEKRKPDWKGR
jgi:enoyl-CoA hydratase/carnithine racemase